MKTKKRLQDLISDKLWQYVILLIFMIMVFYLLVFSVFQYSLGFFDGNQEAIDLRNYEMIEDNYLIDHNMTLEIIDSSLRVIDVKGIKSDIVVRYTPREFYKILSDNDGSGKTMTLDTQNKAGENVTVLLRQHMTVKDLMSIKNLNLMQLFVLSVGTVLMTLGTLMVYIRRLNLELSDDLNLFKSSIGKEAELLDLSHIRIEEIYGIAATYNDNMVREKTLTEQQKQLDQQSHYLISALSHDIKSPITSILGFVELLKEEPHYAENPYLAYLGKSALELDALSKMLFEQIKYQNQSFTLTQECLDISELLREICSEKYPLFEQKGFIVDFDIPLSNRPVILDKVHFKRALVNIINNAIDHNPEGTVACISLREKEKCYEIDIMDDGKGISERHKTMIFNPFFSGDQSREKHGGLGLFISRQILVKHGGELILTKVEKFKTVFRCSIPKVES